MLRTAGTALLALVLAACGGGRDRGPAWPKPSPSETDGGESLAPRQGSSVAAAIEEAADATPSAGAPAAPASSASGATSTTPAAPAARPAPDPSPTKDLDILTTEEIVIEIDD